MRKKSSSRILVSLSVMSPHYITGSVSSCSLNQSVGECTKLEDIIDLHCSIQTGVIYGNVSCFWAVSIISVVMKKNYENHSFRQTRNVCWKGWVVLNLPFGSQQRWSTYVPLRFPWSTTSMFIQVKWKWPLRNHLGCIQTSISTILKLFQQFDSQFHFSTTSKEEDCAKSNSSLFHL